VLGLDWETLRLFLHVLGATVWVGGQIMLGALVPVLRRVGADAPRVVARAYARIAWPAFVLLVGTGIWNIVAEGDRGADWQHTLDAKLVFVALSGVGAYAHQRASSKAMLAAGGAVGLIGALLALLYGVRLAQ
jgi:putative copper export protein